LHSAVCYVNSTPQHFLHFVCTNQGRDQVRSRLRLVVRKQLSRVRHRRQYGRHLGLLGTAALPQLWTSHLQSRMAAETLGQVQHTMRLNVEFQCARQTQDAKSSGQGRCIVHLHPRHTIHVSKARSASVFRQR